MKHALTVAGLLALGIALTAPGVLTQRGGPIPIDPGTFTRPDLAIEKIVLVEWAWPGNYELKVLVDVRNIGKKSAPPCNVMISWCHDATHSKPMKTWMQRMEIGLEPGEVRGVFFEISVDTLSSPPLRGMLIAVADPPVAGKPMGEINESPLLIAHGKRPVRSETNNIFGVIFDSGVGPNTPIRWDNPVMQ